MVTGAGRRLGKKLALAFADKGYDVIVHYNKTTSADQVVQSIRSKGSESIAVQADLRSVAEIQKLTTQVSAWTDYIDVLINNAGIFPTKKFEDVDEALWDETMNTNVRSMFFLTQALLPLLNKAEHPCIVNIASLGGYQPWNNHIPYCISKAGVIMLTRALAKRLAPHIRVNAVAPGIIVLPDEEKRDHPPEERIPLRRYGSSQDFIDAVLFLTGSAQYITGQIIPLDGGLLGTS